MAAGTPLKNILFDLGGVILDIDVNATKEKFYNLGFPASLMKYPENMETDLFYKYETGKLSTKDFRNAIRKLTGLEFTDAEFDEAWNAMIVGIPKKRAELLTKLAQSYELFMLSNTSPLHVAVYESMFEKRAGLSMSIVFNRRFYSHKIGYHKPDPRAFRHVIKETGIVPHETLFLDDNIQNIKTAQLLGFRVIHIHDRTDMTDIGYDL
ncbi:MAG: HAD family phosphatase [Bacteroidales bacterium]|nr:HAD family phosphatase [Bacteroidales bacterium]MBN2699035.1 HAD family phosphatase [Bacteroidales bacterium]